MVNTRKFIGGAAVVAIAITLVCHAGPLAGQSSQPVPASSPASQPTQWGAASAGLQAGASTAGDTAVGAKLICQLAIRNSGTAAVKLGPAKDVFAWFVLAQGQNMLYTQRLPLEVASDWPNELAAGQFLMLKPMEVSAAKCFEYAKGLKVVVGYPSSPDDKAPVEVGTIGDSLAPGSTKLRWFINMPRDGESSLLLTANTLELTVAPPDLAKLSPKAKAKYLADLLTQFDKDAFAAQAAHDAAIKLGSEAVEALAKAAAQARRPAYARMWLVAAIADIRDEKAAKALADLLNDKSSQVRNVVAYHGPKQHSDALDKAILDRAIADESGSFTSYALLGFMVFRGTVQPELVEAGLDSPDARTRATATGALAGMASDFNKNRLRQMLNDKDARVREVAGRALRAMGESTSQPASRPS